MAARISRAPRPQDEMVLSLRRHIRLLEKFADEAFRLGNVDYAGEVAGKLRLLVVRFGSNEPLLLRLMETYDSEVLITLDLPPVKLSPEEEWMAKPMTIDQYLGLHAVTIRVPSGELVTLTNTQFIRAWAEQAGSAHEDWKMDASLRAIFSTPLVIFGLGPHVHALRSITQTVLSVANTFLRDLDASAI